VGRTPQKGGSSKTSFFLLANGQSFAVGVAKAPAGSDRRKATNSSRGALSIRDRDRALFDSSFCQRASLLETRGGTWNRDRLGPPRSTFFAFRNGTATQKVKLFLLISRRKMVGSMYSQATVTISPQSIFSGNCVLLGDQSGAVLRSEKTGAKCHQTQFRTLA
jgi:hypothetical protein